jgi:hypothetical protein
MVNPAFDNVMLCRLACLITCGEDKPPMQMTKGGTISAACCISCVALNPAEQCSQHTGAAVVVSHRS